MEQAGVTGSGLSGLRSAIKHGFKVSNSRAKVDRIVSFVQYAVGTDHACLSPVVVRQAVGHEKTRRMLITPIPFDHLQGLQAVEFRHEEVDENQIGAGYDGIRCDRSPGYSIDAQRSQQTFPIRHIEDVTLGVKLGQSTRDDESVTLIVISDKNIKLPALYSTHENQPPRYFCISHH